MKSEVEKWVDYHATLYPGFVKYMAEHPQQLQIAESVLAAFTVEQLSEASRSLYMADTQPNGYGSHFRKIAGELRSLNLGFSSRVAPPGPSVMDGEYVASCGDCADTGLIDVVSPGTLRGIRDGKAVMVLSVAIRCHCRYGADRVGEIAKLPRYEDGRALFKIRDVERKSFEREKYAGNVHDAELAVVREMVAEYVKTRRTPQVLDGSQLR